MDTDSKTEQSEQSTKGENRKMSDEKELLQDGDAFDEEWLGILGDAEQEAEAGRERLQYGKLTVAPRYVKWIPQDGTRKPQEISPAVYRDTPDRQRSLEVVFSVEIQEFNPALDWTYERNVSVGSADWHRILKPSVEELTGEGSMDAEHMGATLGQLRGKYVAIADVPQTKVRDDGKVFRTAKFVKIFDGRDACRAEWYERYGAAMEESGGDPLAAPSSWESEWDGFDIESEASQGPALKEEYGDLETFATDYYGVSVESVVKAYTKGGSSASDIASLFSDDAKMTPAKIKKMLS
jgi:hypothetical protein